MAIEYSSANITPVQAHSIQHIPKFTGKIWFVDGTVGNDSNVGDSPHEAFATIGAAIAAVSAGDAITVRAGTYDENGLNLNLDGLELWCEIGVIVTNSAAGATEVLTVSGNYCRVHGPTVMQAGIQGIVVTGTACQFYEVSVAAITVGFTLAGVGDILIQCRSTNHTTTGFDIGAANCLLYQCNARGAGGATRGFYLSAATADDCFLHECSSSGNATSGFEIVTGVTRGIVKDCTSGAGDGRWIDADSVNTWPGFSFDNVVHITTTLNGSGTYNICRITGVVKINFIYGVVETATPAGTTAASLQLFPTGGAAVQLTSLAGSNISSLPAGSMIAKAQAAAQAITVSDNSLGFVSEQVSYIFATFSVGQMAITETHIRLNVTEAGASGVIHWHVDWEPLSDDGFVGPA